MAGLQQEFVSNEVDEYCRLWNRKRTNVNTIFCSQDRANTQHEANVLRLRCRIASITYTRYHILNITNAKRASITTNDRPSREAMHGRPV